MSLILAKLSAEIPAVKKNSPSVSTAELLGTDDAHLPHSDVSLPLLPHLLNESVQYIPSSVRDSRSISQVVPPCVEDLPPPDLVN